MLRDWHNYESFLFLLRRLLHRWVVWESEAITNMKADKISQQRYHWINIVYTLEPTYVFVENLVGK